MERNKYNPDSRGGGYGWVAVAGLVTAYDVLAPETLTNSAARALHSENRVIRYAARLSIAYVAAHLYDAIPSKYDAIDQIGDMIGRNKSDIIDARG